MSKRASGFNEWTQSKNNVNICTGCGNNCVYCYSRSMAYDYGWAEKGNWHNEIIRQKDVDKKRNLYDGLVGFPTSHDVTPNNLEAYLTVLDKLLRAGNKVLIVSKPRFACIAQICEAAASFKDKIIFRFTIGAMEDNILSYWEPNAPSYQERKDALLCAVQHGFTTSVSIEPMLNPPMIDALIKDLAPYVTDTIWIGKMNHIWRIKKVADKQLIKELEHIELYQRDEMVLAIYKTYKDNPKIQWKSSIKEVVGIEAAPETAVVSAGKITKPIRVKNPPFNPKLILVHKKAEGTPMYEEVKELFPTANYEVFEEPHTGIHRLMKENPRMFLKTKINTLILALRSTRSIEPNPNKNNSDFMFNGIGWGCIFGCVYCYSNFNKLRFHKVAPYTLFTNIDQTIGEVVKHQAKQGKKVVYDFSCNNDSIAEGAFFSSTAKLIETIAETEYAYGICTTKATEIDYLLNLNHNTRTTIKLTLAPPWQIKDFEYFTGNIDDRISAVNRLKKAGYNVGINFSPLILRDNWLEDYIELFKYVDRHLIDEVKENLIGEAFFYTHRPDSVEKLPLFKNHFEILHNPDKYPIVKKAKRDGIYYYRGLEEPKRLFRENLQKYLPYLDLRYLF